MNTRFTITAAGWMGKTCLALVVFGGALAALSPTNAVAQEKKNEDPASDSRVIEETLSKIRQVAELERYLNENKELKKTNQQLKQQIASLDKQVKKLAQELKVENERLRRQLLKLPSFEIKSKIIGPSGAVAVLQFEGKSVRIKQGLERSVPVSGGIWTLMKVLKISKETVELEFPELERVVLLHD